MAISDEMKYGYHLEQRDTIAGLFALVCANGKKDALLQLANEYKEAFGGNLHVENYLKEIDECQNQEMGQI